MSALIARNVPIYQLKSLRKLFLPKLFFYLFFDVTHRSQLTIHVQFEWLKLICRAQK